MAWYDEILNQASNPFTGVGEKFKDLNILGASVPKQYEQMQQAGLLGPGVYEAAIQDADTRGKRNALIQGLLAYGTQDFNKGYGSILPYLAKPVAAAMGAAQQTYDELPKDAMRNIELSEFKKKQDLENNRLAMINKFKDHPNLSDEEKEMFPYMTTQQRIEALKPTTYKPPTERTREFVVDGINYKQLERFDNKTGKFIPIGERIRSVKYKLGNASKRQQDLIKTKIITKFPNLSADEIEESAGYIWDFVDKDMYENKTPFSKSVDNTIQDFIDKQVITKETGWLGSINKLNPKRIDDENGMQPLEEKDGWSINKEINEDKIKDTSLMSGFR